MNKNIFLDNLSYSNLYNSYLICKKGKSLREDVIKYSFKFEYFLNNTLVGLKNNLYIFGEYKEFYVIEPKKRRILAAPFRDRIVHTWFVNYILIPIFEKGFMISSYACIKKRGMHKCSYDVQKCMRICKRNYFEYYILKFDISKYFDNIDKDILFKIINKKITDKNVIWLLNNILNSSSKYYECSNIGIPIGNLTSQIFDNIYLNELDKYIKEVLKCKYYFRYMDDGVILLKDKKNANIVLKKISLFLEEKLHLKLNSKTNIFKNNQGVNFCGYYITEKKLKIRFKGKQRLKNKLKKVDYLIRLRKICIKDAKKYISGHIGYICHADVTNLINKLF